MSTKKHEAKNPLPENSASKAGLSRRQLLAAGAATGLVGVAAGVGLSGEGALALGEPVSKNSGGGSGSGSGSESGTKRGLGGNVKSKGGNRGRMPVVYLPHGGGPWPFVELGFVARSEVLDLSAYLESLRDLGPQKPTALLVISAHWEEPVPTLMTHPNPPMLYDYYGFPPESYTLQWPAPGAPALAQQVKALLSGAGFPVVENSERGFDHGTFVPLKVTWPEAEIPTLQLSLQQGLDPAAHLAMGRALAPLRDQGVLIVGSGMSYHNLREFSSQRARLVAETFDRWLQTSATAAPEEREEFLLSWSRAPMARAAHPREEHLLPLMVVAGAAGDDAGSVGWSGTFGGARISALHYG